MTLGELLEKARGHVWTYEERRVHAISFAYGNVAIENPAVTREMIEREYERQHLKPLAAAKAS